VAPDDSERTRVTGVTDIAAGAPSHVGGACVIVIYGAELGRRLTLGTESFEIGRSSSNDLFIDQESVSRHHARISCNGDTYSVVDLGSTNGTYVNDERIRSQRRLVDGDQVRIGRSILKFMTGENVEVQYHEEIYRLMTVDGLSQIFNRRYFDEALEREVNRARRYERVLSLILFDIDHFKVVNDTHGHLVGDSLLRSIALSVKPRLRREDIFARTGGEEFAVLLPEIAIDGARTTAEKIRSIVQATPLIHEQDAIACTVSLGVAALVPEDAAGDELYRRADERLYEAKQTGRNRVSG
jgi:diguanylate cyclase (GGDEF)-like protein